MTEDVRTEDVRTEDARTKDATTGSFAPRLDLRWVKPAVPSTGGAVKLALVVTPPALRDDRERPPLNLALVLDRSGSMNGPPLRHAKRAATCALGMLDARDRVAVVAYDHEVDVLVPSTPATAPAVLAKAIRGVEARGYTALHAGWLEGGTQVARHHDPKALNRVILLTDGLANRGETDPDTIRADVAGLAARGIATSALGLGRHYDEDLLEDMAESGGGNYYLATTAPDLRAVFTAELRGLSATLGTDVRLAFLPACSGIAVEEVLNDLPREDVALVLPDLVHGLPLEIGATLGLPPLNEGETELGTLELHWNDPAGRPYQLSCPVRVEAVSPAAYEALPEDAEVASLHAELRVARLKDDSTRALDRGDLDAARALLARARDLLRDAPRTARIERDLDDLRTLETSMKEHDHRLARKLMKSQAYRKRKSFYPEHLEFDPSAKPTPGRNTDRRTIGRPDGSDGVLELVAGDLTAEAVDAILNPTNIGLFGTGRTVDGAVHRRGGRELTRACREIGHVGIGSAVVTPGFRLPAKYVLHTAVPVWDDGHGKARGLLELCYASALELAERMELRTLAVPAVGAGTCGFPPRVAAEVALATLIRHLGRPGGPDLVRVVLLDPELLEVYRELLEGMPPR